MTFKPLLLLIIPLFFASCAGKETRHMDTTKLPTHHKQVFDEGRYCSDYLKFECLPESKDSLILNGNEPLADGKFAFYDWDEKKYNNLVRINDMEDKERKEKMEHYVLTKEDYKWMDQVRIGQWYKEMEVKMEKQYPGFWGDAPRIVRHRWMRLCVAKGMKYGYGLAKKITVISENPYVTEKEILLDKDGKPFTDSNGIRSLQQWIELCGRIGLNFDRDPKWKYILDFVKINKDGACAGAAVNYIDFTIYGKDKSRTGNRFTDWYLQDSLGHLPYPNRPVPRLND